MTSEPPPVEWRRLSVEQFETAVSNALRAGDLEAAVAILQAMAVVHPSEAQTVLDMVQVGLKMGTRR